MSGEDVMKFFGGIGMMSKGGSQDEKPQNSFASSLTFQQQQATVLNYWKAVIPTLNCSTLKIFTVSRLSGDLHILHREIPGSLLFHNFVTLRTCEVGWGFRAEEKRGIVNEC